MSNLWSLFFIRQERTLLLQQLKVAPVGKGDPTLAFKAGIIIVVSTNP